MLLELRGQSAWRYFVNSPPKLGNVCCELELFYLYPAAELLELLPEMPMLPVEYETCGSGCHHEERLPLYWSDHLIVYGGLLVVVEREAFSVRRKADYLGEKLSDWSRRNIFRLEEDIQHAIDKRALVR